MRLLLLIPMCAMTVAAATPAGAQTPPPVAEPPFNVMLPNYNTVPVGEIGSLEAGAFVARANDTSSAFYNPAGLTRADRTSVSGNAGVFQFGSVAPEGLDTSGGSFQQIPAMFAFVLNNLLGREQWAGGMSIARVNAWMQGVDADRTIAAGASSNHLSYASESELSGWLVNMGVGYTNSDRLRLGGSLDAQLTQLDRRQSLGDQYRTTSGLAAVLVGSKGSATMTHVRVTAGGQYDVTSTITVGAVVRSGGLGLLSSGAASLEGLSRVGATTTTASFFDQEADVEYRIPLELKGGVAWKGPRAQVEVDVVAYPGTGVYDVLSSNGTLTVIVDQGLGVAPQVQEYPFRAPVVDSRTVVNVAVGGSYKLKTDGAWILHGGYSTDGSPVGSADTTFTKIDLQKITAGVSARTRYFLGSAGLQYTSGTSDDITLAELQNGQQFTTRLKVKNLGFLYSLALLF